MLKSYEDLRRPMWLAVGDVVQYIAKSNSDKNHSKWAVVTQVSFTGAPYALWFIEHDNHCAWFEEEDLILKHRRPECV